MPVKLTMFIILLAAVPLYSQSVSSNLISSAGKTSSNNDAIISWSLGETVVSSSQIHEGYQFPQEIQGLITAIEKQLATQINFFPNPTSDILYLEAQHSLSHVGIKVLNSKGQEVTGTVQKIEGKIEIDFRNLKAGIYFVRVTEGQEISTSYKIIKK